MRANRVLTTHSFAALAAAVTLTMVGVPRPASAQIPTPESVLGYAVGADFELANYEQ